MRNREDIEQDIKEFTEELIPLLEENSKLFKQKCTGRNGKRINEILNRLKNLYINLNQAKQISVPRGTFN